MQHALGIVGSQAGGLMAAQEGAMVKRFHCGRAAQSGVYSATLAKRGFTGITDVLEAPYGGYLSSLFGQAEPAAPDGGPRQDLGNAQRRLQAARERHQHTHGARRACRHHAREQAEGRRYRACRRRALAT